jgi:DNA-binding NarL/FixJ family response regulator
VELGLSLETVRVHMKKIYQKLHVNSNSDTSGFLFQYWNLPGQITTEALPIE